MTTSQPPVPTSLRCLAVLPAIIMLGGYALLGPKPAEDNALAVAAPAAVTHEVAVVVLPTAGPKLASVQSPVLPADR